MSEKIVRLKISNIKRLSAVELFPDGNTVVIGGQNEQGKSSILDAICMALAGAGSIPPRPIRDGKTKAEIILETTNLIVTRKFSASGTSLVVTAKDGTPFKSPQALLDEMTGSLSFDPLEFSRLCEKEPKKAAEVLRQLAGLDFTKLDADRATAYENRTLVNRELAAETGKLANFPYDQTAPKEEVSVAALTAELTAIQGRNKERAKSRQGVEDFRKQVELANEDVAAEQRAIAAIEQEIKQLTEQLAASNGALKIHKKTAEVLSVDLQKRENDMAKVVDEDEQATITKINEADSLNAKFRNNQRRAELSKVVDAKAGESETLSQKISELDAQKAKDLENAKFPTKDISFDESGVLLEGLPFAQGSTAQRIKASLAMGMALNPKLRVVLIREGSLLDSNSLELVCKMAVENDTQVWIERVSDGKECQIIIEDGAVKE